MKKALCLLVLLSSFVASANQIIYTTTPEDFNPIKETAWKMMVGNTSFSSNTSEYKRSGNGLSLSVERSILKNISAGAQLGILRSNTTQYLGQFNYDNGQENQATFSYNEALVMGSLYGKFSFVNYPVNKWNLIQINLLGGVNYMQKVQNFPAFIYGASVSYNYDNLIGLEIDSKIDLDAQAITSANVIGYF